MTPQISPAFRVVGPLLSLKSVNIGDRPPLPSLRSQLSDSLLENEPRRCSGSRLLFDIRPYVLSAFAVCSFSLHVPIRGLKTTLYFKRAIMSAKKIVSARTVLLLLGAVLISLSLAVPSFATKGQQVEVEGYALIVDGKKDIARENAINNAFRRAVEQVVGVMVESETMVKNFELLNDKVYAKSAGYIKQYTIVGETVQGEELRLRMRALVSVRRVGKDLDDIGLLIKEVGKPRLLLLISEQNGLSESPSYWWGGNGGGIGVVENTILSKFVEK